VTLWYATATYTYGEDDTVDISDPGPRTAARHDPHQRTVTITTMIDCTANFYFASKRGMQHLEGYADKFGVHSDPIVYEIRSDQAVLRDVNRDRSGITGPARPKR
jgi:hypothetical protein